MLSSASSLLAALFVAIPWRPVNSLGYFDTATCTAHPDPHMNSWHGIGYEYHHGCDVVFVKTDDIEIHLRLEKNQLGLTGYSLIERIGIRFGDGVTSEVLEMDSNGDHFRNNDMTTPNPAFATIGGLYPFTKNSPGAQAQYMIDLQPTGHYINIQTSGNIYGLGITIRGHGTMFIGATGMCGKWRNGPNLNDRDGVDMVPLLPTGAWNGGLNGADFGDAWQVDPTQPSFDPVIMSSVTLNPIANGLHAAQPDTCVATRRLEQQPDRELEVSLPCYFCDSMPNLGQRQNCIFDAGILGCDWVQSAPYYDTKDTVWYNEEDNKKDYYPCLQEADPDSVCSRVGKCTQWCDTENFFCETCLGCNNEVDYNGEMLYERYLKGCSCQIPMEVPVTTHSCPDGQAYLQIEVQGDEKSKGKNSYVLDVFHENKKKWKKVTQKKKTLANEFHLYGNCHDVNKCYRFTIVDKKSNGICCESGYGYYKLNFDGQEIMELFEDGKKQERTIGNCQGCVDPPEKKFELPDGTALFCTQLLDGGFKKAICEEYPASITECCESCPLQILVPSI